MSHCSLTMSRCSFIVHLCNLFDSCTVTVLIYALWIRERPQRLRAQRAVSGVHSLTAMHGNSSMKNDPPLQRGHNPWTGACHS